MFGTLSMVKGLALITDTRELFGVWTVTVSFLKIHLGCLFATEGLSSPAKVSTVVPAGVSLTCLLSGDTKNVLTGSADNSCRLWDCETGTYKYAGSLQITLFIYVLFTGCVLLYR